MTGTVSCTACGGIMCYVKEHGGGFGVMECDICGLRRHEDSLDDQRIKERDQQ